MLFKDLVMLTIGVSEPPAMVKPIPLSFSFWNSIVVSEPTAILQVFGSCGSAGLSGSLATAVVAVENQTPYAEHLQK